VLRRYSEFPNNERASTIAYLQRQLTPQVISRLVAILEDENQDIRLRGNAAMALGAADLEAPLIAILGDENQDRALRTDAASALGFTNGSPTATASLIQFMRSSRAYQAGLNLSIAESEEYLSSELLSSEFNLIFTAFISLQAFSNQAEVDLFFVQFEQENPTLFDAMIGLVSIGLADGPELVRLLQERSQTPAICRVSFIQRFLWRCR
jgi:HEAT repeat protein